MWVPQSFGSPNIAGNQPADYWPGGKYVDWVGLDIYSKFAGAFGRGVDFFEKYDRWPFVIGEYGSGKTFFLQLVRSVALQKKLVTVHADLSPDRRLHATGGQRAIAP